MLVISNLITALKTAVLDQNKATEAQTAFADALKTYILDNLEIAGVYVGVAPTPIPPHPDPLNGAYSWKPTSVTISGASLLSGAGIGLNGWISAMQTALQLTVIVGLDTKGKITLMAPTSPVITLLIDFSSKPDTMQKAYDLLGAGIVNSIQSGIMNPVTVPATSADGGTGTVTLGALT